MHQFAVKTTVARFVHTHTIKRHIAAILPAADLQWTQMAHHERTLAAWVSQLAPQSSPLLLLQHHLAEATGCCCCSTQHVAAAKVPAADDTPAGAADAVAAVEGPGSSCFGGDLLLVPVEVGPIVKWICFGSAALPAASDRLAYTGRQAQLQSDRPTRRDSLHLELRPTRFKLV